MRYLFEIVPSSLCQLSYGLTQSAAVGTLTCPCATLLLTSTRYALVCFQLPNLLALEDAATEMAIPLRRRLSDALCEPANY